MPKTQNDKNTLLWKVMMECKNKKQKPQGIIKIIFTPNEKEEKGPPFQRCGLHIVVRTKSL